MAEAIYRLISHRATESSGEIVLFAPDRMPLSYRGLLAQVEEVCRFLSARGLGPGDPVALVLPNGPEAASAFLAVAACATCAPLNPAYRAPEFDFYLSDLAARLLIVAQGLETPAREVARARGIPVVELVSGEAAGVFTLHAEDGGVAEAGPRPAEAVSADPALILHTSGTTSRPKMVPLSQANLCASARNIGATLALTPADRCLNVMPLFHIHGLMAAVLASVRAGAGIVCTPGFHAPSFFDWMEAFEPTWYTAVPTMHQAVLARSEGAGAVIEGVCLRFIRSSSASLPPQVMAALERTFGVPVVEAYGMTEAAHQMACNPLPPAPRKPGSVGPAAGPDVAIMDAAGTLMPLGATGEIVIRGENVTAGYLGNSKANAAAFTDGWFRTGDQGRLDADGYLFITGRLKELINRGGEKVSPREVDEVLLAHPSVGQAVAFAVPHPRLGEEVAAAVVPAEEEAADKRTLQAFVAAHLAPFKVPRRIVFVDEIPKGPSGSA